MPMIHCIECGAKISTLSAACVKCGAPIAGSLKAAAEVAAEGPAWTRWLWIAAAPVAVLLIAISAGGQGAGPTERDRDELKRKKEACAAAIGTAMGRDIRGYTDHQAYQAHVREKCEGLEIDGRPIGR